MRILQIFFYISKICEAIYIKDLKKNLRAENLLLFFIYKKHEPQYILIIEIFFSKLKNCKYLLIYLKYQGQQIPEIQK